MILIVENLSLTSLSLILTLLPPISIATFGVDSCPLNW
jgi:hypothetical protein